jgi:GNAT superfamily N-acetyltransferase|tara:strand:+ start:823 stop:1572 length:750 start_codon:yes stop_codon:yes gene_type:complete
LVDAKSNELRMKRLQWDSEQLGIGCGLIESTESIVGQNSKVSIDKIAKWLEANSDLEFITVKATPEHLAVLNHCLSMGAYFADTKIMFKYSAHRNINLDRNSEYRIEIIKSIDSTPFLELSEEMTSSRFYADPKIGYTKANRMWRTSIKNHCEGFVDKLQIASKGDQPCGLIAIKFFNTDSLLLSIVGVIKAFQRRNIGNLMLRHILYRYAKDFTIFVETQATNIPAQKLYIKNGFEFHHITHILHLWR